MNRLALLLDIDGVVNEPQQPISDDMLKMLGHASIEYPIYFVTGNTFTKSIDILNWHGYAGIFCNNADDLRDKYGYCVWRDEETPPLPRLDITGDGLANNQIEWRGPRFVNYCPIGRFATKEQRDNHSTDWRDRFVSLIHQNHSCVEAVKGGQVSIDIYSKGADKARAAKFLNGSGFDFIFIGDKTEPGGNDYPILEYCKSVDNKNICLTTNGPSKTMELLDQYLGD